MFNILFLKAYATLLFIAKFHKHDAAHRFIKPCFGNSSVFYSLRQRIVNLLDVFSMITNDNHIATCIDSADRIVPYGHTSNGGTDLDIVGNHYAIKAKFLPYQSVIIGLERLTGLLESIEVTFTAFTIIIGCSSPVAPMS